MAEKRFLTTSCKIKTLSSVSEQKANIDKDGGGFKNVKSFRKVVYIHPDDVGKLPSVPIKFTTPANAFDVFFYADSSKCHLCSSAEHFRSQCPRNEENGEPKKRENESDDEASRSDDQQQESTPACSNVNIDKQTNNNISDSTHIPQTSEQQVDEQPTADPPNKTESSLKLDYGAALKNNPKRVRSITASEASKPDTRSGIDFSVSPFTPPSNPELREAKQRLSKGQSHFKKMRVETSVSEETRTSRLNSLLEPARAYIESSQGSHALKFDEVVSLLAVPRNKSASDGRNLVHSLTHNTAEVITLLNNIYGLIAGKGVKSKITSLRKCLEYDDSMNSSTDHSIFSDSERSDVSQDTHYIPGAYLTRIRNKIH